MDSEQLVSRPLQELQQEAIESVKKVSTTEKITSVKNNVCEHALKMASKKIEKEKSSQLKRIHDTSSKMRFEVKLLDIDKRRHGLELQQRMDPNKDLTYDENQIENTEKRLGVTKEDSFYLDKKLTYPLRAQPGHERVVTPFVRKARKAMRQQKEEERAQTARTTSTSGLSASSSRQGSMVLRRGSKSAPPGGKMMSLRADFESDKLPSIHGGQMSAKNKPSHVKFVEHASGPFRQNTPEPLFRAKTYYPGMERRLTYTSSGLWDSDDEDLNEPYERIDLRALLFKDKYKDQPDSMSNLTTPRTLTGHSSDTHSRRPPSLRPPTQEHLKQENQVLRGKIDNFLGNIRREEPAEDEEQANTVEEEDVSPLVNGNEKKEKANLMLKIFSKPLDPSLTWGYVPPPENESAKEKEKSSDRSSSGKSKSTKSAKSTKENRNMWEFIRGRMKTVNLREKYTPNDLLLQQITGLMVGGGRKSVIPLNSASRALRYTPTFRMQQVLQDLIKQRTKYEQLEVNELKKKHEEGGIFTEEEEDGKQDKTEEGVQEPHQPPHELKEEENNDS